LSPFRIDEKDQSFLFSTTKKAEYAISITNRRKTILVMTVYCTRQEYFLQKKKEKPGYSYHFIS
jgi:hypothetical protein